MFVTSLVISVFVGIALVVAAVALDAVLGALGVKDSVNTLVNDLSPDPTGPLLTTGRLVGGAALLAAVDVVLLTALATLGAFLYNLCASLTGGIEVSLSGQDQ